MNHKLGVLRVSAFNCCFIAFILACALRAENWANWRGPSYNGSTVEAGLPKSFGPAENAKWAADLPGQRGSTPIIWDDYIFISTADAQSKDLLALAFSRKDGKL